MPEKVRVLRVIEYVGDRGAVEWQVARSLHGEKTIIAYDSFARKELGEVTIKAATIGVYPEILENVGDEPKT